MSGKVTETPVRFSLLEKTRTADFLADFPNYVEGLVRSDPGGFVITQRFADVAENYRNFPLRSDDVWVVTFPKCGTTWTQEMVWMITHDCDTEAAKEKLQTRSPFIEMPTLLQNTDKPSPMALDKVGQVPSPRVVKTHLPFYLLPSHLVDTCKVVYVVRNPKDVIVSYFHHHKIINFHNFTGDIDKFAEYFMNDEGTLFNHLQMLIRDVVELGILSSSFDISSQKTRKMIQTFHSFAVYYAPFFGHILDGWAKKDHPNVLFLFYEDMKKNLRGEIEKVCAFLGKTLSEDQLQQLTKHLHFDSVSKNTAINFIESNKDKQEACKFVRKGKTGDWKNHFSPELNRRIEEWIEKSLDGSDLKFTMELEYQD